MATLIVNELYYLEGKLEPETLNEQPLETERTIVQDYTDHLYEHLVKLDLLNDHQHAMAHRTIDLIASVQQFHRDLENPSQAKSPLTDVLEFLKKSDLFKKEES